MKSQKIISIVKTLCSFGMRQGDATIRAAGYIQKFLNDAKIPFRTEYLSAVLPDFQAATLKADGIQISCEPTSFVPGSFAGNSAIVSSLISSRYLIDVPNINFNPLSKAISRSNFYFAPSVAVRAKDLQRVADARDVRVSVRVRRKKYKLPQLLVGNTQAPHFIVFAHFDSIGPGAIDNASGTAVCLSRIVRQPDILKTTLFVFDPHEELSYDFPTYWGKGFRMFEKRYSSLLKNAKRIIVVDSVGNGKPQIIRDKKILRLAFPILKLDAYASKTISIGGDIRGLMEVYHSNDDLPGKLTEPYLEATDAMLAGILKR